MATSNTTSTGSLAAEAQAPTIRAFQFDPSGLGAIATSVNQFRGDVGLPLELISFTTRGGLAANLRLIYASNVQKAVDTWNLDAPTGPLGLGWSMGFDFIARAELQTAALGPADYYLVAGGASNRLYLTTQEDDEWQFELENYQFWSIRYFVSDERWEVVKEDGTRWIFGGAGADAESSPVQYGVKWGGRDGNWIGSSVETHGQVPIAVAWNLAEIRSTWGDRIGFLYENDAPQVGGLSGLRYTRSSRIRRVYDPSGRSIEFAYAPKVFDTEIREYQIPHLDPSDPALISVQDRYDTRYLDFVEVRQGDGEQGLGGLVLRLRFGYELKNASLGHQGDPDFYKRYLTGITYFTEEGLRLPSLDLSYYNEEADLGAGTHRGALKSILYPQGGTARFVYRETELEGTDRSHSLSTKDSPRVWFGSDYVVITHFDGSQLKVTVYSWSGSWVESPDAFTVPRDVDLGTLRVATEAELFALSFQTSGAGPRLFVLLAHREKGRSGRWVAEPQFTTLPVGPGGRQGVVATGTDFAVALASGANLSARVWDARNRRWVDRSRDFRVDADARYALAARGGVVTLAMCRNESQEVDLQMYVRPAVGTTFVPARLEQTRLSGVLWEDDSTPDLFWSLGPDYAVSTFITEVRDQTADYTVLVQQWDESYVASVRRRDSYQAPTDKGLPFARTIASGNVIGNLGHVLRYDGVRWISGTLPADPVGGVAPALAYGDDAAISSLPVDGTVVLYDSYRSTWRLAKQVPGTQDPIAPTIAGDYLSVGRFLFYRDNEGALRPAATLDANMKPRSLVNRAPWFVAYEDQSGNTHVLPLDSGVADAAAEIVLPDEHIDVGDDAGPGEHLVGPSALVTFKGDDFRNARQLKLYQFVNRGLEGRIVAYPVAGVQIDDGYPDDWGFDPSKVSKNQRFYYDCSHVSVTPDGSVTEFAASTVVYGEADDRGSPCYPPPSRTTFGRTESRFHNDRTPVEAGLVLNDRVLGPGVYYYSFLSGLLYDKTDYDGDGEPKQRDVNFYEVRTSREETDEPGVEVPIVGGYVRPTGVETTLYETVMELPDDGPATLADPIGPGLRSALAARDVALSADADLVETADPRQWRLYPDVDRDFFLPVTRADGRLTAAVGVLRQVGYAYSPATGLATSDWTSDVDSRGKPRTVRRRIYYAWQVPAYATLKQRHIWGAVVLTVRLAGEGGPLEVPIEMALTTFKEWYDDPDPTITKWAACQTFSAVTADEYDPSRAVPARFDDWDNRQPPAGDRWRRMGVVTRRAPTGPVVEVLDVTARPTAVIYGARDALRISEVANALREETTYVGFESNENLDGWHAAGAAPIDEWVVSGDAHTGRRSLRLAPSATATLRRALRIRDDGTLYVLSAWHKTPPGFVDGEASWAVESGGAPVVTFPITGTSGAWEFRCWPVRWTGPKAAGGFVDIELVASNHEADPSHTVLLDDIFFVPLASDADASIYNELFQSPVARVGPSGATEASVLDGFQRVMAAVANGRVRQVSAYYQVRQEHSGLPFVFPADDPNSLLEIDAAEGGLLVDLVNGDGWKAQWHADQLDHWRVQDGRLIHKTGGVDAISFLPTEGQDDYGVRVTIHLPVRPDGSPAWPNSPLGVSLGGQLAAVWTPGQGWKVSVRGHEQPTAGPTAATDFATEWLLVAPKDPETGRTSVFFFADGIKIFAALDTGPIAGPVGLTVADADVGFSGIATFRRPRLRVSYLDGSGKSRQQLAFGDTACSASQTLYDPIGRPAIALKTTLLASYPLGYVPDLVRTFDPVTGVMTGRVADFYPADQGYPYFRTEFYPTAQSLAKKQGAPGLEFAIVQSGTLGSERDENAHIRLFAYGTNSEQRFGSLVLPANQYFVTRKTDPNGNLSYELTTKTGQTVERTSVLTTNEGPLAITTLYAYDRADRLISTLPPAGVDALRRGVADADAWASTTTYDFPGQQIEAASPDSGRTQFVNDPAGQVRFLLDAVGASHTPSTILYNKYDALGRLVESGSFQSAWDRGFLQDKALHDPDYPGRDQPHRPRLRNTYDGDGTDPTLFGRLARTATFDDAGLATEESFAYDLGGALTASTLRAAAFDASDYRVGYAYNNLGEVSAIDYPVDSPTPRVVMRYNALGQAWTVGTESDPGAFATFGYNALGQVDTTSLAVSGTQVIMETRTYNSPGWLTSIAAQGEQQGLLFREQLTYTAGGFDGAGYYDGTIASASFEGAGQGFAYEYRYDSLYRLSTARNSVDPAASLGVGRPISYDSNGNFVDLKQGDDLYSYRYKTGTNQVTTVDLGGQAVESLTYEPTGSTRSSQRRQVDRIAYAEATGQPIEFALSGANGGGKTVRLGYDGQRRRAVKRVVTTAGEEDEATLYVRGTQRLPLYQRKRTGAQTVAYQFLYGPDGLFGLQVGAKRYTVVKDSLGSVRRVVDEAGALVASFDFTPFGGTVRRPGGSQPDLVLYRFTGQELDPQTGLYNFSARLYDPELGRFFQVDPQAQYPSAYLYAGDNPINLVDPSGEEALTAFLVIVLISAVLGAVAGGVTYAVSSRGNFDVGKFFLYTAVGFVAGAAGGAAGYGAGLVATALVTAVGTALSVSTSTSVATGIVVGAVSGAADGAVSSTLMQVGTNLIEGRPPDEDLGLAAAWGALGGAAVGAAAGGITGLAQRSTFRMFDRPQSYVGCFNDPIGANYAANLGIPNVSHAQMVGAKYAVRSGAGGLGPQDALSIQAHGFPKQDVFDFTDMAVSPGNMILSARKLKRNLRAGGFNGGGLDLINVCYAGSNGTARYLANRMNVPVRGATGTTTTWSSGYAGLGYKEILKGATIRTYYPSKLKTGWVALFGY